MIRAALATAILALLVPSVAAAQAVDAETQANFDRAAAYWADEPLLCEHPAVVIDQAVVYPYAGGTQKDSCNIWVGDYFIAASPARRCAIIVHEWGHLTGHPDGLGAPDDPLGVMGSDAMPASCVALDPAPIGDRPVDVAYVRWARRVQQRTDCTASANMKKTRARRVVARRHCVTRYGRIGRPPGGA